MLHSLHDCSSSLLPAPVLPSLLTPLHLPLLILAFSASSGHVPPPSTCPIFSPAVSIPCPARFSTPAGGVSRGFFTSTSAGHQQVLQRQHHECGGLQRRDCCALLLARQTLLVCQRAFPAARQLGAEAHPGPPPPSRALPTEAQAQAQARSRCLSAPGIPSRPMRPHGTGEVGKRFAGGGAELKNVFQAMSLTHCETVC